MLIYSKFIEGAIVYENKFIQHFGSSCDDL